jgi:hypothetical protein
MIITGKYNGYPCSIHCIDLDALMKADNDTEIWIEDWDGPNWAKKGDVTFIGISKE